MAENVQVAVRVRPFNDREKALDAKCCIAMEGTSTILKDLDEGKPDKPFAFDYSFWSHDGFRTDENGYAKAESANYADQQQVYDLLGKSVLDNAWGGYHCCLFAYGQTGSGKSYSMIGYGKNRGIVPISCEEIFKRIATNTDPDIKFEVMVSMLEIYNEQVQDLLINPGKRAKTGLEIHENKQMGVYVEGLSKRPVESYDSIEAVMSEGTSNRTIGSTLMNATSSRAHTVITVEFRELQFAEEKGQKAWKTAKFAVINLVDLAGSEKSSQTGASGDRLKEGCAINKSLSALGNVISALAEKSAGKLGPNQVVPYRDSKLTRLLQSALGGNSRTIMICAISPASSNYEETLSTLRYADRAKKIKNAAVINEDPQVKLIRQLKEENDRLRAAAGGGAMPDEDAKKTISALEAQLAEYQKSWEEKIKEAELKAQQSKTPGVDLTIPHFANLNDDPMLSAKVFYSFPTGSHVIGIQKKDDKSVKVPLFGLGCFENHATITNDDSNINITFTKQSYLNGDLLKDSEERTLKHGDRLIFGQNNIFVYVDPKEGDVASLVDSGSVSFQSVKKEFAEKQGEVTVKSEAEIRAEKARQEEVERKLADAEEARKKIEQEANAREVSYKKQMAELSNKETAQMEAMMAKMEEERKKADEKLKEAERKQKEILDSETFRKNKEMEAKILDEKLMHVLPLCKEATLIAKELKKPYEIKTKLHVKALDTKKRAAEVVCQVSFEGKHVYDWTPDTLENRVFLMRELLEKYADTPDTLSTLSEDQDPFWDPVQTEKKVGSARLLLESLTMQLENEVDSKIISEEGKPGGILHCEVWPLSRSGSDTIPDDELVEDSKFLIGQSMKFKLKVTKASGLPSSICDDVRIQYRFYNDEEFYSIPACVGHNQNPVWSYERVFTIDLVTEKFLTYLKEEAITFEVFALSSEAKDVSEKRSKSKSGLSRTNAALDDAETPSPKVPVSPAMADGVPSISSSPHKSPVQSLPNPPKKKSRFCAIM